MSDADIILSNVVAGTVSVGNSVTKSKNDIFV